jgi:5-methylcytosine-specific restriction protein A
MPQRLKTLCRYPGCRRPTRERYCEAHVGYVNYDANRHRDTSGQRGYDAAWAKLAALRRRLDFGHCQDCQKQNYLTPAKIVDHIVPIYVRPDWRLELGNTQVLCGTCHRSKTSDDLRKYGHRTGRPPSAEQMANRQRASAIERPPRDDEQQNWFG